MARGDDGYIPQADVLAVPQPDVPAWADAAARGPTPAQWATVVALVLAFTAAAVHDPGFAVALVHLVFLSVFAASALWRALATRLARRPGRVRRLADADLPSYTVIVPLYREAPMVAGLVGALQALDYPKDKLQVLLTLEADDDETLTAIRRLRAADGFERLVAPPGAPQTKPRACDIALAEATGALVVVYDAEDRPHPLQLKEAASRFAAGAPDLACLQAPLRILGARCFLARQFALEYAAQFEVVLPGLVRLGAPFPLGGTSNHFRAEVLRAVGGWDAWNVTEDADLGFRLAAKGWRAGLLATPTWESAPAKMRDWRPQRARWVKGYMQTWGVHMRAPFAGGAQRFVALQFTIGLAILSAFAHGPVMLMLAAEALFSLWRGRAPTPPSADFTLLTSGWAAAILAMSAGARRAGLRMRLLDGVLAPAYWALQSWAALLALCQLCTRPHHWDKTRHRPPPPTGIGAGLRLVTLDAEGEASVRRAA